MAAIPQKYLLANGKVAIFKRSPLGKAIDGLFAGDVSALSTTLSVEKAEHKESYTGQNSTAVSVITGTTARIEMVAHNHSAQALARITRGTVVPQAAGTITDEDLGTLEAGQVAFVSKINLTSATITVDGQAAEEGEDYALDKKTSLFTALTAGAFKVATAEYGASDGVGLLTTGEEEYVVRFSGVNKVDGKPYVFTAYRVRFDPAQSLNFIGKEVGSYTLAGDMLLDDLKPASDVFGQFGKIETVS